MLEHIKYTAFASCLFILLLAATGAFAWEAKDFTVEPDMVEVNLFYHGRKINVGMKTSADMDVVFKISGNERKLALKEKGKKWGLLWVNVGDLELESVPSLYVIRSSRELEKLAGQEELNRLGIGYDALEKQLIPESSDENEKFFFGQLIKLKEKEKLFSISEASVEINHLGDGYRMAHDSFELPSKAPVGEYKVEFFGFENGVGTLLDTRTITLKFGSTTHFLTSLAKNHGLLYGILASFIAIVAGLITGLIFKGGGHH